MVSICDLRLSTAERGQKPEANPQQVSHNRHRLAIRTAAEVIVIDPSGGARLVYPIPPAIGQRSMGLLQLSDDTLLVRVDGKTVAGSSPHDLYWLRPGGEVQRHERLSLQGNVAPISDRMASVLAGIAAPLPVAWVVGVMAIAPLAQLASGETPDYASALSGSLSALWPGLLLSCLLAGLAIWLCVRRQRQYAMTSTRTWVVVMLLMGLPAFLGYLFHCAWPTRISCPACGKAVPPDRDACPQCQVPYPEPEPTGIEVRV